MGSGGAGWSMGLTGSGMREKCDAGDGLCLDLSLGERGVDMLVVIQVYI